MTAAADAFMGIFGFKRVEGGMKKCSKCGEVKSESAFSKSKASKDGLKPRCKSCIKQQMADIYAVNRKAQLEGRELEKSKIEAEKAVAFGKIINGPMFSMECEQ